MRVSKLSSVIEIPDYWKAYVNPNVDLLENPHQPCPFHHEEHGKSLSYSKDKKYFSCFGACHVIGGDVVKMHMLNYRLRTYEEAEESLARLYGIQLDKEEVTFTKPEVHVNEEVVEYRVAYAQALKVAKTVDDWLELDYIMSQYPPDVNKIRSYTDARQV